MKIIFKKYKSLKIEINPNTTYYKFIVPGLKYIVELMKDIGHTHILSMLYGNGSINSEWFSIPEFGLLELREYTAKLIEMLEKEKLVNSYERAFIKLVEVLEFIDKETWYRDVVNFDPKKTIKVFNFNKIKKEMKFSILPHQKAAFEKYEMVKQINHLRGGYIDAAPGTGKTFMSLAITTGLDYKHTIIIAPKSTLEDVWVKSVTKEVFKKPQSYVLLNTKSKKIKNERFIIMHYEYLPKLLENKYLVNKLKKLNPNIIVDEVHNFNNPFSLRSQSLIKLADKLDTKDIILLTGTPVKMEIKELTTMLFLLDKKFPKAYEWFKKFYSIYNPVTIDLIKLRFGLYRKRIEKEADILPPLNILEHRVKIKNPERFLLKSVKEEMENYREKRFRELLKDREKLYPKFLEYVEETLKDRLTIKKRYLNYVNIIFKFTSQLKVFPIISKIKKAKEIERKYILKRLSDADKKNFTELAVIIKYPMLKAMGEALGKVVLNRRIECYVEIAKVMNYKELIEFSDKKTLFFSNYIKVCDTVVQKTLENGYNPLRAYGNYIKDLDKTLKLFINGPKRYNPLVATYKTLSTGVRLTVANVLVTLDLPFRSHEFDQTISRIYRIGQDKPSYIFITRLDTGNELNITDRGLFILNLSKSRIEMITGNEFGYELPQVEKEVDEVKEVKKLILDFAIKEINILDKITETIKKTINDFIKLVIG